MRAPKVSIPLGRMLGKDRDHQRRPATAGTASWLIYASGASSSGGWLGGPQFLLPELQRDEALNSWVLNTFEEDSQIVSSQIFLPRSYSCNFCRREFRSAQALGGHMNVHRRDRARLRQSTPSSSHGIPSNPNQTINAPQLLASPTTHSKALCLVYPMLPTLSASSSLAAVDTPASSTYPHVISSGNRIRKPPHNHPCPHNYSSSPSLVLTQDKTRFYHCMESEIPKKKLHTGPYLTCLEVEGSRQSDALDLELRLGQSNATMVAEEIKAADFQKIFYGGAFRL